MPSSPEALRVLIVDDDPALLRTMADVLRLNGFEPELARDGARAIEIATAHPPAVAIVDLRLPGLNGFAIIGVTSPRWNSSSISNAASGPQLNRGYGSWLTPFARYHS